MTKRPQSESYKRKPVDGAFDAIVIGSGIGGLGAAALLAKHGGRRVLVLERHYTIGGYTHVFHRPGYEWDVGVHYVGDVQEGSVLRALFDEVSNGELKWADMGDGYDTIVLGEERFPLPKGRRALSGFLKERFPGEEQAIDAYFRLVREALSTSLAFHADKAMPAALSAVAGPFMRRKFLKFSDRTTREVLESLTGNQKLIAVLTGQFGDYGLPPSESSFMVHAMVANHYFGGGYYPVGGSERFADTIVPTIEAAGGRVLNSAEVSEVVLEGGRTVGVKMADGAVLRAPIVISDAGVGLTFGRLVPRPVAESLGLLESLRKVTPSKAHLSLYIGLKHTAEELQLPRGNLWLYPNEHYEQALSSWYANPEAPFPVVYVSFPAAKDPDFLNRHPGRSTIDVITAVPWEWFETWEGSRWKKRPADYEAFKERLAQRLLEALYKELPQVKGKLDVYELSTPLTTRHFCAYEKGELYGLDHSPARFRQRFLRPQTPIPGLFLTGQDVTTCGVAGALFGGVLTASAVLKKNLLPAILKSARERSAAQPAA